MKPGSASSKQLCARSRSPPRRKISPGEAEELTRSHQQPRQVCVGQRLPGSQRRLGPPQSLVELAAMKPKSPKVTHCCSNKGNLATLVRQRKRRMNVCLLTREQRDLLADCQFAFLDVMSK